ncbi:coproporphyrinogen III oxidase [Virgibacillus profundi]|uniref:Heme chaperone HemW n=1 Tax=Virgibacillus profundi TaxID=2024555 RepID=A0A2A2IBR9_9BACI|nr:radical SAM family heme chaperone HemW [Virgibacillus profundi]PAV29012.1 coproporphyrinogen III oxidase [Virgibacillus profundi]PXY53181.1 oxygen-independent coproporphyrinogen III oxidase [Virgibacillus profundi]
MNLVQSVYIHIPFCQQICHYCDFVKFFYNEKLATQYIEALANEMKMNIPGSKNQMKTIYIGGGTPTALNIEQLRSLLEIINKKFDIAKCEEFTIEVNPGDLGKDKINLLKAFGVSRISFGVQVMDDQMLKDLGRLHKVSDVYKTVDQLQQYGFTNISLDLIYALPNQTVEQFQKSLNEAMTFDLPHYSTYALQIEPKTVFFQRHKKGVLPRPAEEEEVQMYEILKETMKRAKVDQYEISNFAKPGYESKHNRTYWSNEYYYGFGAGAHGYLPGKRIGNIRPLPAYIKQALNDGKPILQVEKVGMKEQIEEEMFLGMRMVKGINKSDFKKKFGFSLNELYKQPIKDFVRTGLLIDTQKDLRLTNQGMLLANRVFEKFLLDDDFQEKYPDLVQVY